MQHNQHQAKAHKLNAFGFIDYKQPLNKQQDMRTSTYLGNKHMSDTMLGNTIHARFKESRPYIEDVLLERQRISDYKANFLWESADPDEIRNPAQHKTQFIKPFYETKLKFLKRPMQPACSTSHSDYLWRPEQPNVPPAPLSMPTPVATRQVEMDHSRSGYTKFLDPAATSQRLDYCHYTPKQIMGGVAAHDSITFWNWQAMETRSKQVFRAFDPAQCDKVAANECVKRICEYTSKVKAVPNSGMTTEVRENYIEPYKRESKLESSDIHNELTYVEANPSPKKTEYGVLGSGENTRKYV